MCSADPRYNRRKRFQMADNNNRSGGGVRRSFGRFGEEETQIRLTGHLKEGKGDGGDLITFQLNLGPFQCVCIVNIPDQDKDRAPVYVKCKLRPAREWLANNDHEENREDDVAEKPLTAHVAKDPSPKVVAASA